MKKSQSLLSLIPLISLAIIFIAVSFLIQTNLESIQSQITSPTTGILIYIIITIIAIVFAPISSLPLIAVAANLWGVTVAAIASIIGWTIGSVIVFYLCRAFGIGLIEKYIPIKHFYLIEKRLSNENTFFALILLRMTIPVDILSYALSLLTKISFKTYLLTTIIGVTPFAFIYAYLGVSPLWIQVVSWIAIIIIVVIGYKRKGTKK
ncbi:MAG: putative membrane protein YdjX (TVP38/TMEM64 family) [Patescibacteria group bacterium]|jgi:uncharacterized membrane protein YdjX (TVP38/TMEM64 family)